MSNSCAVSCSGCSSNRSSIAWQSFTFIAFFYKEVYSSETASRPNYHSTHNTHSTYIRDPISARPDLLNFAQKVYERLCRVVEQKPIRMDITPVVAVESQSPHARTAVNGSRNAITPARTVDGTENVPQVQKTMYLLTWHSCASSRVWSLARA